MLGALICTAPDGSEVVLKTASGFSRELVPQFADDAIYVPPVITPQQIADALAANDDAIHSLTARIAACPDEAVK